MPRERLLIIGGLAAGMSAASRARKRSAELEIVVLEKGSHVSYGTCGLPYFLSGQVADWKELIVYTPEFFREKRGIEVLLEHEAVAIEPGRKVVRALRGRTQPVDLRYDKLVIATGGAPAENIPGSQLAGVFTCNDLEGTIRLRDFVLARKPTQAVIVGSGYIGLEVADALVGRGLEVAIVERSESVLEGVEAEIAREVEAVLARHGVRLLKKNPAVSITGGPAVGPGPDAVRSVQCADGTSLPAGLVILATGIVPRSGLASSAGIQMGRTGAVAVDERMQTSINSIYAAGDCVETRHLVSGRSVYFPLGTTANKQGRVAGENAAGGNARFDGVVGTLVTKVFELEVGRTGLSVAQAAEHGFASESATVTSISRAKYFQGKPLAVTLVWERTSGRLLGGQMAGEEGVAKRIDVLAMALHARMRLPEMLNLDLSYAPPFAPVWDPILIAVNEACKKFRRP